MQTTLVNNEVANVANQKVENCIFTETFPILVLLKYAVLFIKKKKKKARVACHLIKNNDHITPVTPTSM